MIHRKAWRRPTLGGAQRIHPALYHSFPLTGLGQTGTLPADTVGAETLNQEIDEANASSPPLTLAQSANTGAANPLLAPSSPSIFTTLANDITSLAKPVVTSLTTPYYNSQGQLVNPLTGQVTAGGLSGALAAIGPTGLIIGGVIVVGLIIVSSKKGR